MNIVRYTGLIFIAFATICPTQEIPLRKVDTKSINSSYGKINGSNIIFIGIDSTLATMGVWHKVIGSNTEYEINAEPYSIPLGWINDESIIIYEKDDTGKKLVGLNLETNIKDNIINIDDVVSPERDICIDKSIIVFVCQKTKSNEIITYKYDFNNKKIVPITKLQGKDIVRLTYSYEKDILAYTCIGKKGAKYLEVFNGKDIVPITKYTEGNYAEEIPLIFSEDGSELYYVENRTNATLNKYDVNTKTTNQLFEFPEGVKCIDLSYSEGRLLFTADILNENGITHEFRDLYISQGYSYRFEFGSGRKLFYFEL